MLPAKIVDACAAEKPGAAPAAAEDFRGKSLKSFLHKKEQEYLLQIINSMGGDKEKAAKALNISLATLYRKLELYGLTRES